MYSIRRCCGVFASKSIVTYFLATVVSHTPCLICYALRPGRTALIVMESELIGKTASRRRTLRMRLLLMLLLVFVCVAAETEHNLRLPHVFVQMFLLVSDECERQSISKRSAAA